MLKVNKHSCSKTSTLYEAGMIISLLSVGKYAPRAGIPGQLPTKLILVHLMILGPELGEKKMVAII